MLKQQWVFLVSPIAGDLCVGKSRLVSMGFSYGRGMTYGPAYDRSSVFRAVVVYSGAQLSGCSSSIVENPLSNPDRATRAQILHWNDDGTPVFPIPVADGHYQETIVVP